MGTFRLGVLCAAFASLHALPESTRAPDRERILAESRGPMPAVVSLGEAVDGVFPLLDRNGENLGWATTTYPQAEKIEGYSGPSELLVIFDTARRVKAVSLLHSADTAGHVAKIQEDRGFWNQWNGRPEAGLGAAPAPRIVTGASLTSEAMARGIAARFGAAGMEQWFPAELTTDPLKRWFPAITRIEPLPVSGTYQIWGNDGKLGTVLRSSRMGVSARGFNGTSDVIVCLDPAGSTILGASLLGSRDNPPYTGDVADELKFADAFAGPTTAGLAESDSPLVVSGASVTADAVTTSVREMLRRHQTAQAANGFPWKPSIALSWIALGVLVGLAKWGNRPRVRFAFAVLSVAAGVTLGWMVSQDQLIGWSRNGLNARALLPLLALTAVALVVPAYTGKNIYCNRICPHGAAQTLLGQVVKKRFALPPKLHRLMRRVPWLTLLVIWAIAFSPVVFPFSHLEPFESWSSGFQALLPAVIFTAGLLAAVFLPQGYCHYGCPTGALLKFLTSSPGRWTGKDTAALVLVALAGGFVLSR
jgi:Na+-translocating ferredoxin:NAD+ oxidoreductase RnfG subunit